MVKKLTTKEFVAKARKVHGDKYDYSKVEYINSRTPVTIICPIHGEFQQTPADHLMGHGCRKCGRMVVAKTLSNKTNSFIEKAKEIHSDRYDYSKVNYINNVTKIKIHCNVCGCEFEQAPNNHLNGQGCPNCFGTKKKTTEEFIEEAKKIHGKKYDYSKVEYVNNRTKVCIICPEHGEFWQTPDSHLNGHGCPKCAHKTKVTFKEQISKNEKFIEKARKIHGDKYDYSKVNYISENVDVIITCPKHGDFLQKPHEHLAGCGCKKCAYEKFSQNKLHRTEQFIEEAKKIHGNKYNYSKVEYKNSKLPVIIICKKHGEFKQRPNSHLNGQGCPICKSSKLEQEMRMFLIEKNIKFEEQKRFDWLGLQSLDFYLPDYKVGIECQGRQHYESSSYFGGIKQFIIQRERDNKKKKLCIENHVKIIYYTHYEMAINNKNTFENKEKILKTIY